MRASRWKAWEARESQLDNLGGSRDASEHPGMGAEKRLFGQPWKAREAPESHLDTPGGCREGFGQPGGSRLALKNWF